MAKIKDFETELNKILTRYADDITDKVQSKIPLIAKAGASTLRSTSPKRTGKYAKGWDVKTENSRLGVTSTVYNKTKPQVAHLLEKGHRNSNGKHSKAMVHIAPVEEKMIKAVEDAINEVV